MIISDNCIELIKHYEGCYIKAYYCPASVLTIGYGHTGKDVKLNQIISNLEAEHLLYLDLAKIEKQLNNYSFAKNLKQHQFDALISFIFNLGIGNFNTSTLLKKIELKASMFEIENEFNKWVYANKVKLNGLVKRRKSEAKLYCTGILELY